LELSEDILFFEREDDIRELIVRLSYITDTDGTTTSVDSVFPEGGYSITGVEGSFDFTQATTVLRQRRDDNTMAVQWRNDFGGGLNARFNIMPAREAEYLGQNGNPVRALVTLTSAEEEVNRSFITALFSGQRDITTAGERWAGETNLEIVQNELPDMSVRVFEFINGGSAQRVDNSRIDRIELQAVTPQNVEVYLNGRPNSLTIGPNDTFEMFALTPTDGQYTFSLVYRAYVNDDVPRTIEQETRFESNFTIEGGSDVNEGPLSDVATIETPKIDNIVQGNNECIDQFDPYRSDKPFYAIVTVNGVTGEIPGEYNIWVEQSTDGGPWTRIPDFVREGGGTIEATVYNLKGFTREQIDAGPNRNLNSDALSWHKFRCIYAKYTDENNREDWYSVAQPFSLADSGWTPECTVIVGDGTNSQDIGNFDNEDASSGDPNSLV
jgi:hypothetical protein